jgi:hypothetical protein
MKNRPLVLVILGLLHFLEPLLKIFYFKAKTHFALLTILNNVTTVSPDNIKGLIDFWFIFPLGGIALITVKKWSYPLFISVQIYSVLNHLMYQKFAWPYFAETPFYSSFVILVLNTLLIIYVSLPEVRQLFFNQNMRWWETRIRYALKIPINLWHTNPDKLEQACLTNISDTGAFLLHNKEIEIGEYINLNISFLDQHVTVRGLVVRSQFQDGNKGVGVRFIHTTPFSITKFKIRSLVSMIKSFQKSNEKLSNAIG